MCSALQAASLPHLRLPVMSVRLDPSLSEPMAQLPAATVGLAHTQSRLPPVPYHQGGNVEAFAQSVRQGHTRWEALLHAPSALLQPPPVLVLQHVWCASLALHAHTVILASSLSSLVVSSRHAQPVLQASTCPDMAAQSAQIACRAVCLLQRQMQQCARYALHDVQAPTSTCIASVLLTVTWSVCSSNLSCHLAQRL